MTTLSQGEIERFSRHILLREVGGAGQQRIRAARVLVVGAGGLGSAALLYMAAAGVGTLGVVDDDAVALSNLQRQVIHGTADVGRPKTASAAEAIRRIDPATGVETHPLRLSPDNASGLVSRYDVVVDGSDNYSTRTVLADACEAESKPLVSAAVAGFDGSLTTLMPYTTDADGRANPRYRDLFPEPPAESESGCAQIGVIGPLPGVLGALQALEAIKLIAGVGEPLVGRLLMIDAFGMRFETIRYRRR